MTLPHPCTPFPQGISSCLPSWGPFSCSLTIPTVPRRSCTSFPSAVHLPIAPPGTPALRLPALSVACRREPEASLLPTHFNPIHTIASSTWSTERSAFRFSEHAERKYQHHLCGMCPHLRMSPMHGYSYMRNPDAVPGWSFWTMLSATQTAVPTMAGEILGCSDLSLSGSGPAK